MKRAIYTKLIPLWISIFLFYLLTLAPTVLWGDHAYFQRSAFAGLLKQDGGGHWLWLQLAQIFVDLPIASVAYRLNLLSAVAATVTLIFLSGAMRALKLSWTSIIFACIALAVSHTFWMHAVRAEVYTVFTAVLALQLWLWLSWRPETSWTVHLAAALFGLALLAHQMAILFLPAALFLLWRQHHWFSRQDWFIFLGAFAAGLLPFMVVVNQQIAGPNFVSSLRLYFTHVDVDFAPAMFDFSLARLPLDLALWLGFLGLQFVGLSGVLGLYGLLPMRILATKDTEVREDRLKFSILSFSSMAISDMQNSWLSVLIFYAVSVFFAFSYRVNDQFVFYLPSYIAFSFFIANGWQKIQALPRARTNVAKITALLLIVGLPISVYFAAPRVLAASQVNPLDIRTLPGRDPNQYFLWPASRQDDGAERYARSALQEAAPNSVIIADHTPFEPLLYLQTVEGVRPDVNLIRIEPGDELAPIIHDLGADTAIYLADNNPNYYNLTSLPELCLKPAGNIYQLFVDNPADSCQQK